jgi:uncharacterized protein (DUF305 family)
MSSKNGGTGIISTTNIPINPMANAISPCDNNRPKGVFAVEFILFVAMFNHHERCFSVTVQPTAKAQRTQRKNFKKEKKTSQKKYLL